MNDKSDRDKIIDAMQETMHWEEAPQTANKYYTYNLAYTADAILTALGRQDKEEEKVSRTMSASDIFPDWNTEEKPKPFPISACCNASVNITCQACGQACQLAEWNKPKPPARIEPLRELSEQERSYYMQSQAFTLMVYDKLNECVKAINDIRRVNEEVK